MSTHHKPPRPPSPCPSIHSETSVDSQASWDGGKSPSLQAILNGFEAGSQFSQLAEQDGRGQRIVTQTRSLLDFIASKSRDSPALCFDRFDGRTGRQIYLPPQRAMGGVMLRCRLANDSSYGDSRNNTMHIHQVNNNITVQSSMQVQETNNNANFLRLGRRIAKIQREATTKSGNKLWV